MSKADLPAVSGGGRSRGRPSIGASVPIRLPDVERAFAEELGSGIAAKGVRLAINAAGRLGYDATMRLAGPGVDEADSGEKRGRGRPRIGDNLPVRLSESEVAIANALGAMDDGKVVIAEGARRALRACSRLGVESTMRLAE